MIPIISPAAMAMAEALVRNMENGGVFHAKPYRDITGTPTIGTGLTRLNGKPVTMATPAITPAEDDAALAFEFGRTIAVIQRNVTVALTDGWTASLISIGFNDGATPLTKGESTLLAYLNAGNPAAAADQFPAWCHSKGVVVGGLEDRRQVERAVALDLLDPCDAAALNAFHTAVTRAREAGKPVPVPAGASAAPAAPAPVARPVVARPAVTLHPTPKPAPQPSADDLMAAELEQLGADSST